MPRLRYEYLVCYDVEDNKTRTRLYKQLLAYGLRPVQKSVLWGFLTAAECASVKRLLSKHIEVKGSQDKALVIPTAL